MRFNDHSELRGRHAILSPSSSAWLRYDDQQLHGRFHSWKAARRGSDLHDHAHESIRLGVYLGEPTPEEVEEERGNPPALFAYVADGIELDMSCEVPLYYSEHCFGHADTLSFDGVTLRIHDLKTGITPSKMEQLKVYAALFCLEYGVSPAEIEIELRIYQRKEMNIERPEPYDIEDVMVRIVQKDAYLESLKEA